MTDKDVDTVKVALESRDGLNHLFGVVVSGDVVANDIRKRLQKIQRTASMAGFRPGKIPMAVIEKRYESSVKQEVVNEFMQRGIRKAVEQQALQLAGPPELLDMPENADYGPDQALAFRFQVEVFPEVKLDGIQKLQLERWTAAVSDEDVEQAVEALRQRYRRLTAVDRPGREGDVLYLHCEATLDGKQIKDNGSWSRSVVIGRGEFPEFEEQLKDKRSGSDCEFDLLIPAHDPRIHLRDKQVHFRVHIDKVMEPSLPELDEEFCECCGITDGGVQKLRDELRSSLGREADYLSGMLLRQRLDDRLVESVPLELPNSMLQQAREHFSEELARGRGNESHRGDVYSDELQEKINVAARRHTALRLIYEHVKTQQNLVPEPERVLELIRAKAANYQNPESVVNQIYQNQQLLQSVESQALAGQVADWLLERIQVEEIKVSFDHLRKAVQTVSMTQNEKPDEAP